MQALPPLREELTLHVGSINADGAPTWTLQDPVRNRFYQIDWITFLILSHWQLRDAAAICAAIKHEAPLEPTPEDVETVLKFLAQSELLQSFNSAGVEHLLGIERRSRRSRWQWLLHHYLFFRIPLFRPDAWLTAMMPRVDFFYSRTFLRITLLALVFGLLQTFRQWTHFTATFIDTLSWEGLAGYAVVLIAIKVLHEFGHAFTAKRYGCRVPTMGIAFLVMWPVAYTDVNETWKLQDRRQRLNVGAAGMLTELAVAAWATLAWALLPDGQLRGWAFLLAAVTWISTLAINASPFMRFDGYFLLSDWLGIPNLHARAFALARWHLRECLFALQEEAPEHFSTGRRRFLIAFAWLTWLYRCVLFFGIAVLVYQHTFKALGIFLFAVEIAWFIVLPIADELREWKTRWRAIMSRPAARARTAISAALLCGLSILAFLPINFQVRAQGLLRPSNVQQIYAPDVAIAVSPLLRHGEAIVAGQTIIELDSNELKHRAAVTQARLSSVQAQLTAASYDTALQSDLPVLREQFATTSAEADAIAEEKANLILKASFNGVVVDPLPALRLGDVVARHTPMATVIDPKSWEVKMYVEEGALSRLTIGDRARFYPETPGMPAIDLTVTAIDRDASRLLSELPLAATHGGQIPAHNANGAVIPDRAVYGVKLSAGLQAPPSLRQLRGRVVIYGEGRTLLGEYLRTAMAVVLRDVGTN